MENKDDRSEILRRLGPLAGMGTMMAASIGLGVWGGYWADSRFGTKPWLTMAGLFLGLVVGTYNAVVAILSRPKD